MIDEKIVTTIRNDGSCLGNADQKTKILSGIGFPIGKVAEHVIITGCFQPFRMPNVLRIFKNVLDHLNVSYTILQKEYCCTWGLLGRTAVMAKNEDDIVKSKDLSREFILENFRQAEKLKAKSIVLFCSACEPAYSNFQDLTSLEVISQYDLIDRYFMGGAIHSVIDFYGGCYRFRKPMTNKPIDTNAAIRILNKIEGLRVNHLDSKLCCYIPPLMERLEASISSNSVVNLCTGCYHNLKEKLKVKDNIKVMMLAETVWQAIANGK